MLCRDDRRDDEARTEVEGLDPPADNADLRDGRSCARRIGHAEGETICPPGFVGRVLAKNS